MPSLQLLGDYLSNDSASFKGDTANAIIAVAQ